MSILFKFKKVFSNVTNPYYFKANRNLVFAATEHSGALKSGKYKTVIDAGANRGQFALVVRSLYPSCKIISFEPLLEPRKLIEKLFHGDNHFRIFPYALGESNCVSKFHISKRDDSSSLLNISNLQAEHFPNTEEIGEVEVSVKRLDSVLRSEEVIEPALLKIDVQGGESALIRGASGLLSRIQYIYVEASFIELYKGQPLAYQVVELLSEYGYCLNGVYNVSYDKFGKSIQADFFFSKK